MDNYCSECGAKIESSFNFCPNCGSEVNFSFREDAGNQTTEINEGQQVIICSNCGDENSLASIVCQACGVTLSKSKATKTAKVIAKKNTEGQIKAEKIKSNNKQRKQKSKNNVESKVELKKQLDTKKILLLAGGIITVVSLILLASGIFDSSSSIVSSVGNEQQQSSGIDLNAVAKINDLRKVVEQNPNNTSALLDLANLQFDSGFFEEAAKNYEQYLKFDEKNAEVRIDMAVCFYNMRQYDKAETEILTALKYSPNHQTGYLNLGVINLAKQNVEKAREWFNKAVEVDPNSEVGKKAKSLLQSH